LIVFLFDLGLLSSFLSPIWRYCRGDREARRHAGVREPGAGGRRGSEQGCPAGCQRPERRVGTPKPCPPPRPRSVGTSGGTRPLLPPPALLPAGKAPLRSPRPSGGSVRGWATAERPREAPSTATRCKDL